MASKPLVLPETFNGEGSWDDWIAHFGNVAAVNKWDAAAQILWLKVRLTGRAQKAFQRLTEGAQADFKLATKALRERFEPANKRELYVAEFQVRRKKKSEGWADIADDLRVLADKAYPELEAEARERLALHQYLALIDNTQVAFSVKQKRPKDLEEAVSATLEMESYLIPSSRTGKVSQVSLEDDGDTVVAAVQGKQDAILEIMQDLSSRMEKLEKGRGEQQQRRDAKPPNRYESESYQRPAKRDYFSDGSSRRQPVRGGGGPTRSREKIVCHKCGLEGHYARGCAARRSQQQGN